jgi:penicillin-binding protein 1C
MFKSLIEVNRPEQEAGWEYFSSSRKIAWKTGTSFGFRDAWAVGTTPEYTVSVWTGNPDGEGRPGLTGLSTSAPVLFEIFNLLPPTSWFQIPYDDLTEVTVCSKSGHRSGLDCPEIDTILIPESGKQTPVCPYHKIIHLDEGLKFRVNSDCYPVGKMIHKSWFILPPVQEWYFKQKNAWYSVLPSHSERCKYLDDIPQMQMIYPEQNTVVYVPYELDGSRGRLICEAAHRNSGTEIFWHLDSKYLGSTKDIHQMAILPENGPHILILTDSNGSRISVRFEAVEKKPD